jgi:predicted RNA-binding protein with RPS1 domain
MTRVTRLWNHPAVGGHAFISYSQTDRSYVDRLAAYLTDAGVAIWFDDEVKTGEPFGARIQQAIDDCAAFLLVLTPAAMASKWVRREISYADEQGKPMFPIMLEPSPVPLEFAGLHHENMTGGRLPGSRLVATLRALTEGKGPRSSRPTVSLRIPPYMVGIVIGPGNRTIVGIAATTRTKIDIGDDGTVHIAGADDPSVQRAAELINDLAYPRTPEVGEQFLGTVVKTARFGAFVSLVPGRDGLLRVERIGDGRGPVENYLNEGDKIEVVVTEVDRVGKIILDLVRPGDVAPARKRKGSKRRS